MISDASRDATRIKADIEETRADLVDTIDALQERLSPRQIAADAREAVTRAAATGARDMLAQAGETAGDLMRAVRHAGTEVAGRVRQHPTSFAVFAAAAGLGLWAGGRRWLRSNRTADTTSRL